VHRANALAQLGQILSMLQAFEEIAFRSFLAMGQRFEHAMFVEETRHLVKALLQTRFGSKSGRHNGLSVASRQYKDSANFV